MSNLKVVLFCGGLGLRMRDYSEKIPKPMGLIGPRPILWHLMKYYAHFGHNEFIICLGHGAEMVKQYFLNYDETISNDFVLDRRSRDVMLLSSDIDEWKMTFLDTGVKASVGERLVAVREHLSGEDVFLANYSDGLTDLHLPTYIDYAVNSGCTATFLAVHSSNTMHVSQVEDDGKVNSIYPLTESGLWINGGFFVLKREIFDFIGPGEDLVEEPFYRLILDRQLGAYKHRGFWAAMDTFKERQALEDLYVKGTAPWEVWKTATTDRA
ncbi:MAG: glucose-1-phosphate cytidylyltransferase [Acidimicrobiia bacterium]|nr:glucose-1-phosphate cytidylyltransferase [Acidimicrobiia bacterium]